MFAACFLSNADNFNFNLVPFLILSCCNPDPTVTVTFDSGFNETYFGCIEYAIYKWTVIAYLFVLVRECIIFYGSRAGTTVHIAQSVF